MGGHRLLAFRRVVSEPLREGEPRTQQRGLEEGGIYLSHAERSTRVHEDPFLCTAPRFV